MPTLHVKPTQLLKLKENNFLWLIHYTRKGQFYRAGQTAFLRFNNCNKLKGSAKIMLVSHIMIAPTFLTIDHVRQSEENRNKYALLFGFRNYDVWQTSLKNKQTTMPVTGWILYMHSIAEQVV